MAPDAARPSPDERDPRCVSADAAALASRAKKPAFGAFVAIVAPREMLDRWIDRFAELVTKQRKLVLLVVVLFVAFCAAQLPRLQTDTAPENLIISFGGYEERVREFHAAGTPVLMVSHNPQAVRDNCTRCLWLDAGRLRADGATEDVLAQYSHAGTDPNQRPAGKLHLEETSAR